MHVGIAIVGSGFAGLGAAIRLKQRGESDFVVFERAADIGGTWRDNTYPGCCCDIPSHVYSYSFELSGRWTRGFAPQPEIHAYMKHCAAKHGVMEHVRLEHDVLEAAWDDDACVWRLETSRGPFSADVLIAGSGPLTDPAIPDIPGLDSFTGTAFHSARWRHDHDLTGERVAVIGTGASAIQFVPAIQPQVGRIHVFQRTPPWVMPRFDHKITRPELALLRLPGVPALVRWILYWLMEVRVIGFRNPWIMRIADRVARAHMKRAIKDPVLRRKLTPSYTMGCKRVLMSDDYLPALTRENVEVVTDGVAEVRGNVIVTADGTEREVDTIIFGTGFRVTDPPIADHVRGRGGQTLAEHWRDTGMRAYKGTTIDGFPNLFFLCGPNTGLGHNSMIFMIESQIAYVMDALRVMRERRARVVEVRREAVERFSDRMQRELRGTVWTAGNCKSWYLDDTGRNTTLWPSWTFRFRAETRKFDPEHYEVKA
jgi:cation diffusion facilitator CzcD-associated flavoprotein CzcO